MDANATRVIRRRLIALLLPVVLGACGSDHTTATVTSPSAETTTEAFAGGLWQSGSVVHTFAVVATGAVTVGLTSVAPLSTMSLGVALGSWDGATCTAMTTVTDARAGATAIKGTAAVGNYCVKIFDSGNVPSSTRVTYTAEVVHP
jgi:hypothetical protein